MKDLSGIDFLAALEQWLKAELASGISGARLLRTEKALASLCNINRLMSQGAFEDAVITALYSHDLAAVDILASDDSSTHEYLPQIGKAGIKQSIGGVKGAEAKSGSAKDRQNKRIAIKSEYKILRIKGLSKSSAREQLARKFGKTGRFIADLTRE